LQVWYGYSDRSTKCILGESAIYLTVTYFVLLVELLFSTICLLMIGPQNRRLEGMRNMVAGFSSLLLAIVFVLAGNHVPMFFPYVAGNVFLLIGLIFLHFSFPEARYRNKWQIWFSTVLLLVLCAGTLYFTYAHNSHAWRVFFVSLALAAQSGATALMLFWSAEPEVRYPARCTALMFLLQAVAQGSRMIWIVFHGMAPDEVDTPMRWIVVLSYAVIAATVPLLYFWKNMVRLQGELERLALTDPLTGLLNRRGLQGEVSIELARLLRKPDTEPFSVIAIDVDHFKVVNDRYGHAVGDAVLRDLTAALRGELRAPDRLARSGGEEFVILLPQTSPVQALLIAERLRQLVEAIPLVVDGQTIFITASFGVATAIPPADAWDAIMNRADTSLYRAKRSGRNRVADVDGVVSQRAMLA
jgi:diguanylate cyclase (GGDEF)-like protein